MTDDTYTKDIQHIPDLEDKPYNQCIACTYLNAAHCDGPNFLAMSIPRFCEWCRLRKEFLHRQDPKWTNAYIAKETGMSEVTITRIMSGKVDDLKLSTVQDIMKLLVNGSWGQYPCAIHADSDKETVYVDNPDTIKELERTMQEAERLRMSLEKLQNTFDTEVAEIRAAYQRKVDFLRNESEVKTKLIAKLMELDK